MRLREPLRTDHRNTGQLIVARLSSPRSGVRQILPQKCHRKLLEYTVFMIASRRTLPGFLTAHDSPMIPPKS